MIKMTMIGLVMLPIPPKTPEDAAEPISTPCKEVMISQAAYRHLQNTVFGGKLQLHDIGPAKGKVLMARRQPEMDRIVRLDRPAQEDLRRRIQIRVLDHITAQIGDPAWHIYTAFACARHFPNLFKVQKLKHCIWQSFHFRNKTILCVKSA